MNIEDRENIESLTIPWWIGLCCAWLLLDFILGMNAVSQGRSFTALMCFCAAGFGCRYLKGPAAFAADCHYQQIKERERREQANAARQQQRQQQEGIEQAKHDNQARRDESNKAQSRREITSHLGAIDNYVRALESETNPSERTMILQAAQSKLTALKARRVANEIAGDAMTDRAIVAHAQATSQHLTRIGLREDRLNLDIIEFFKLPTPVKQEEKRVDPATGEWHVKL